MGLSAGGRLESTRRGKGFLGGGSALRVGPGRCGEFAWIGVFHGGLSMVGKHFAFLLVVV